MKGTSVFGQFGRSWRCDSLDWKSIASKVGGTFSTIGKGLSFDFYFEFSIIIWMVNTSSWRNRHSPFGNCLTTHERIVRISWLFILLGWDASLHLLLTIIDKVIVLLVLKISCADRCIIHLLLGDLILAHFGGEVVCVGPWLYHLYSIHNWNIYYFKI